MKHKFFKQPFIYVLHHDKIEFQAVGVAYEGKKKVYNLEEKGLKKLGGNSGYYTITLTADFVEPGDYSISEESDEDTLTVYFKDKIAESEIKKTKVATRVRKINKK